MNPQNPILSPILTIPLSPLPFSPSLLNLSHWLLLLFSHFKFKTITRQQLLIPLSLSAKPVVILPFYVTVYGNRSLGTVQCVAQTTISMCAGTVYTSVFLRWFYIISKQTTIRLLHPNNPLKLPLSKGQHIFSVKDQIANILGFVGHPVSYIILFLQPFKNIKIILSSRVVKKHRLWGKFCL